MRPLTDADVDLRATCPTCGAQPGIGCWTPNGVARLPHKDRVALARMDAAPVAQRPQRSTPRSKRRIN